MRKQMRKVLVLALLSFPLLSCKQITQMITPDPTAPGSPSASEGTYADKIVLSWNPASNAESYRVFVATSRDGQFTRMSGETVDTSTEIAGVEPNVHYFYKVAGVNSANEQGPFSTTVEGWASLPAPQNLTASQGTYSDRIGLSWDEVIGAYQYFVYEASSAASTYTKLSSGTDVTDTSVNITDVTPGTHYFYKVSAADASDNEGLVSTYAEGWAKQQLDAPTGLTASQGTYGDKIELTWTAVDGAAKYYVYRSASATGTYTKLSTEPTTTSADVADVIVNTHYHFKVAAVDSGGVEGLQSTSAEGWAAYSTIEWVDDGNGYYQVFTNDPAKYGTFFYTWFTGFNLTPGYDLTANLKKLSGDSNMDYGLLFYFVNSSNFWYFCVDTLGYYAVFYMSGGSWYTQKGWTTTSSLVTGYNHLNTLKISYYYSSPYWYYDFYINNVYQYGMYSGAVVTGMTGFAVQVGDSTSEDFPSNAVDARLKMTSPYTLPTQLGDAVVPPASGLQQGPPASLGARPLASQSRTTAEPMLTH